MIARLRQGARALLVWVRPVDAHAADAYLTPPLQVLFRQMRPAEQQHSLNVLRTLIERGKSDPSLLIAALLHDVGKSRAPYWLWERVIVVLARKIVPGRVSQWGEGVPVGWRRPFVISKQHPAWSAEMAAAAGADPLSVELIARHQRKLDHAPQNETERLLLALQAADDSN